MVTSLGTGALPQQPRFQVLSSLEQQARAGAWQPTCPVLQTQIHRSPGVDLGKATSLVSAFIPHLHRGMIRVWTSEGPHEGLMGHC